ncbi:MAG: cyclodeaminase/cyclohydrolase family protein [Spirochaetota bacterium]|nr:MAG: cyclodeaminase/cyclohydrolase family protein [Spirochaetota bacterium]
MYVSQPLHYFLDKLCSNSPEPGGGSASALTGAIAASLSGMLAALTVNKKGYENVKPEMEEFLSKAQSLKDDLLVLLQKDTEAFDDASKAFKLPKETEDEKKKRAEAIEAGLKKATEVPLAIMEKSLEVSRLSSEVLKKGNEMAISDGAISALFAEAACIGAMMNVRINFSWMKDKEYVKSIEQRVEDILDEVGRIKEDALSYTLERLKS